MDIFSVFYCSCKRKDAMFLTASHGNSTENLCNLWITSSVGYSLLVIGYWVAGNARARFFVDNYMSTIIFASLLLSRKAGSLPHIRGAQLACGSVPRFS